MSKGFIYVVKTLTKDYVQEAFRNVPTQWNNRLYFGPCKVTMRPKMLPGHWVFGISPANGTPRRIVFVAELEKRIPFADAYNQFPDLRGPGGPIHVLPFDGVGRFPESSYKHILGAMHRENWIADLANEELDAFFVCCDRNRWRGRWLGKYGPEIDDEIVAFLKTCSVHGKSVSARNTYATLRNPIAYRGPDGGLLCTGLHSETDEAETLIELCNVRMKGKTVLLDRVLTPMPRPQLDGDSNSRKGVRKGSSVTRPIRAIKPKC